MLSRNVKSDYWKIKVGKIFSAFSWTFFLIWIFLQIIFWFSGTDHPAGANTQVFSEHAKIKYITLFQESILHWVVVVLVTTFTICIIIYVSTDLKDRK